MNPIKSLQLDNLPDHFLEILADLCLDLDEQEKEDQNIGKVKINDIVRGLSPKL